jgi:hypothetical protein
MWNCFSKTFNGIGACIKARMRCWKLDELPKRVSSFDTSFFNDKQASRFFELGKAKKNLQIIENGGNPCIFHYCIFRLINNLFNAIIK